MDEAELAPGFGHGLQFRKRTVAGGRIVLGSLYVDVRSHDLDQASGGQLRKYDDEIDPPDRGEDLGTLTGRKDGAPPPLERGDGFVVVQANDENVTQRRTRLQKLRVAVVNQIETAVR